MAQYISSQPLQTVHEESEQHVGIVHEESPPSSPILVGNNGNEQFESFDDEKAVEFFSVRAITTKQTKVKRGKQKEIYPPYCFRQSYN